MIFCAVWAFQLVTSALSKTQEITQNTNSHFWSRCLCSQPINTLGSTRTCWSGQQLTGLSKPPPRHKLLCAVLLSVIFIYSETLCLCILDICLSRLETLSPVYTLSLFHISTEIWNYMLQRSLLVSVLCWCFNLKPPECPRNIFIIYNISVVENDCVLCTVSVLCFCWKEQKSSTE